LVLLRSIGCLYDSFAIRDKKVVGVFVRFRATSHGNHAVELLTEFDFEQAHVC
jgi:hypothetical protein